MRNKTRAVRPSKPRSRKVYITIREDYLDFIAEGVKDRRFNSRSHAIGLGIEKLQKVMVRS